VPAQIWLTFVFRTVYLFHLAELPALAGRLEHAPDGMPLTGDMNLTGMLDIATDSMALILHLTHSPS
jgi:hypothetical protein